MSAAKNTPGPWVADNGGDAFYGVFGPDGGAIAYLLDVAPGVSWESAVLPMDAAITLRERFAIHEANANLIAAAPSLLAALLEIQQGKYLYHVCGSQRAALGVLKKAGLL